jgi:LmbE family N-acetylglucosaminyl deacetylase
LTSEKEQLDPAGLGRYDSLFIAPHADDVVLGCPGRVLGEVERERRVLVLALFAPVGGDTEASRAARELGADYAAAGLPAARARRAERAPSSRVTERGPEDEDAALSATRCLAEVGPRVGAVHVHAPLGLGASVDHLLAYEASVRAFATERGRNLFLYEERPEAFVPGAVRTRLALMGTRLPPGAARAAQRAGLLRHLWRANEPARLRGEVEGLGSRLRALAVARRRLREARPWNPLRAFGPRLQPVVHMGDESARARAEEIALALLPRDPKGRPRAAERFNARAAALSKALGGVYQAERLWLFLPSGDGLPEVQHPLEMAEV